MTSSRKYQPRELGRLGNRKLTRADSFFYLMIFVILYFCIFGGRQ